MQETLVSIWTRTRRALEAAGVELPVNEARLLVEAGVGVSRLDIITDPRRPISDAQAANVTALAERREAREPMAYILGRKSFWTLDLEVNADVLAPRPETELLVEFALGHLNTDAPARVLDLGVGSGAILLAILSDRPRAEGIGIDSSVGALAVARANAERIGVAGRATFIHSDWWRDVEGAFDLIVSNPPYIPTADIAGLQPEVALYEPKLALDGGEDGLDAYRAILDGLASRLRPGGVFALEVGQGQAEAVAALAIDHGFRVGPHRLDLAGIPRVVTGKLTGPD
jgi:release factor glutamine methyltransferase